MSGCANSQGSWPGGDPAKFTAAEAGGQWHDLDAAVEVATDQSEMLVVSIRSDDSGRTREYALRTATNEPALLIAERPSTPAVSLEPDVPSKAEPSPIALRCTIGRFGDPKREAVLLRRIRHRLRDLGRAGWAPISD